ncbi:hypothetical protein MPTK1_8g12720 [Marchantia polymorpha subsp. ruderalis]|uniref:Uncharacterized protein n=1 Tax=Marchantia polymorpha TaxID=3197 RepID=A0A2R6WJS7_MARPO|nr:hypothetical protein MARPO_0083s0048 [Marchantia polymorpha]BBN19684.1 hypothetical protein Mp_8g12720 [Marchantia polymorpha subsp. ruderalis]|eukprot:PTQ34083.1 hypothetical protein MARPO_0083s0048 [Marchantia polymorpha]
MILVATKTDQRTYHKVFSEGIDPLRWIYTPDHPVPIWMMSIFRSPQQRNIDLVQH